MGASSSCCASCDCLKSRQKLTVMCFGFDDCGKTHIIQRAVTAFGGCVASMGNTSANFSVETFRIGRRTTVEVFDVAGAPEHRILWPTYFSFGVHGVVYVIDGTAPDDVIEESIKSLLSVLQLDDVVRPREPARPNRVPRDTPLAIVITRLPRSTQEAAPARGPAITNDNNRGSDEPTGGPTSPPPLLPPQKLLTGDDTPGRFASSLCARFRLQARVLAAVQRKIAATLYPKRVSARTTARINGLASHQSLQAASGAGAGAGPASGAGGATSDGGGSNVGVASGAAPAASSVGGGAGPAAAAAMSPAARRPVKRPPVRQPSAASEEMLKLYMSPSAEDLASASETPPYRPSPTEPSPPPPPPPSSASASHAGGGAVAATAALVLPHPSARGAASPNGPDDMPGAATAGATGFPVGVAAAAASVDAADTPSRGTAARAARDGDEGDDCPSSGPGAGDDEVMCEINVDCGHFRWAVFEVSSLADGAEVEACFRWLVGAVLRGGSP